MKYNKQIILLPKGQFKSLEYITIPGLINSFINITLMFASILFLFSLLFGGIKIILSSGSKDKLDQAKRQLINAFLGIFIVFSIYALMNILNQFYGIDLLTFEIPIL